MQDANQTATGEIPSLGVAGEFGRVVGRTSWAVIDQGLCSFSNFAASVVLALWLTPTQFGGYMAARTLFWIGMSGHDGLLIQPMMVFGSGRFHDRAPTYLAILTNFHWCVAAMIAAALAAGGFCLIFWGSASLGLSILGFAVASPLVLLQPLLRQSFYIWSHPRLAVVASVIYMVGTFAIIYALHRTATLSSFTAPLVAAGASALSIAGMIAMRGLRLWSPGGGFGQEVAVAHWRYGRWAVLTGVVGWVRGNIYYLVVPILVGLEANAALNVLWNLVLPAVQVYIATSALLVPALSRRVQNQNRSAAPLMLRVLLILLAGAAVYALLVALFGGALIDLIYRGRYTEYANLAWLMGLIVLPLAASTTFGAFLRAHERPDRVLAANIAAAMVTLVAVLAINSYGLLGAVLGLLANYVTIMLVMLWWVLRTE